MKVSTPGRICLFGEHQDYLGLPVIAMAISRRVSIEGSKRTDNQVVIHKPNINQNEVFELTNPLTYSLKRDYFKSAVNVLKKIGFEFSNGFEIEIQGNIPINSGTSSSSALLVSWIHFLTQMANNPRTLSQKEMGELAYQAEVLEFDEPGGMMDQYSTAIGDIIYLESTPKMMVEDLHPHLGTFVLGDSKEPKDTLKILGHVKFGMLKAIEKIKAFDSSFDLFITPKEKANDYKNILSADELILLNGNLSDRDILKEALTMFRSQSIDNQRFGELLNLHQDSLRDAKRVSTPKINKMIEAALDAGALGGKINGSGGGGCMFVYAPNNPEIVAEAIEKAGGNSYIITKDKGTKIE
jgi:galactokinase